MNTKIKECISYHDNKFNPVNPMIIYIIQLNIVNIQNFKLKNWKDQQRIKLLSIREIFLSTNTACLNTIK